MYKVKKQKMPFEQDMYIINCSNCGADFILLAVVGETIVHQVGIDYCPYCGYNYSQQTKLTRFENYDSIV